MNVILYTTHCPQCKVLESKLNAKNIQYEVIEGEDAIIEKGFVTAPLLEVDGEVMNYKQSIDWVNNLE